MHLIMLRVAFVFVKLKDHTAQEMLFISQKLLFMTFFSLKKLHTDG
jgi:hypothetical protein